MLRKLTLLSAAFMLAFTIVACDKGGDSKASQPKEVTPGSYQAPGSELKMDSATEDPTGTTKKKPGDAAGGN